MHPVHLALFWHQHQPYYPDDVSGETLMPWVRLHGIKDYYGMALHLKEVPEFRCTINLVPSLLRQILKYAEEGGSDRHLDVSRLSADGLSEQDAVYLLHQFFMANVDNLIRPYPRYFELYQKRNAGHQTAEQALLRFTERDLRDLQVWNNLTWFHPLAFERDAELRELRTKGRHYTEGEKRRVLEKQIEVLRQIIPLHRELADRGQVELTTTPYYHPIMPLLLDKRCARQAMPEVALPRFLEPYPADLRVHLERGIAMHQQQFGVAPAGMWPSEGSVSQEVIPAIAQAGIQWIATDEEILARSTGGWISRDPQGAVRHPEMLYRPWRVEEQGHSLQIVFRDHALSDLIGFHYQRTEPARAAQDLLGRVEAIGRAVDGHGGPRPTLVPIILDGENCWEYYPDGGVEFLRTLYRQAARHSWIKPVRMGDSIREFPATDRIGRLFAGSWISHNFAIWIGHSEDNSAWDLLHETREFLSRMQAQGGAAPETITRAWDEIYIAEGSDWFWWFGDDHSSAQDDLFDQLFRRHLQNVYILLGTTIPASLQRPISRFERKPIHTSPRGLLNVKVDGRRTYFEWIDAGHYISGNERGTMTLVSEGLLREVFFGFNQSFFYIRVDTPEFARDDLRDVAELRVGFVEPADFEVRLINPSQLQGVELFYQGRRVETAKVRAAVASLVEIAIPFDDLGLAPGTAVSFYLEAVADRQSIDRAPQEGVLEFRVPDADYEMIMWQA